MIEKILTEYWSQATLVLLTIAYFIKRIFDDKSKKIEINHSLFQQNRLKITNAFFGNYAKSELLWEQLSIYEIFSNKFSAKEIDQMIWPILNELIKNQIELQVYYNDKEMVYFNTLIDNIFSINKRLRDLYFDYDPKNTEISRANDFTFFRLMVVENNKKELKSLCKSIKLTYKA